MAQQERVPAPATTKPEDWNSIPRTQHDQRSDLFNCHMQTHTVKLTNKCEKSFLFDSDLIVIAWSPAQDWTCLS